MFSPNWFYLLLAVIVLALGILIFLYLVLKKARKEPLPKEGAAPGALVETKKGEAAPVEFIEYASASKLGLKASFSRAVRLLKTHVTGRDYRYRIPWFLMVGEAQSGKTTILGNTGLNLPLGKSGEQARGIKQGVNWCFFDKGVVLDIAGDYVLRSDGESSNSSGWNSISRLLQKYRPERPLDGLILTIPCTDLIGAKSLSSEQRTRLEQKAASLYRKLWQTQKVLGMSFPVYLIVTKCDQVAGFRSFCNEIPLRLQNDIFGWSSPYTLETAYKSEWVDEAFRSLHRYLFQIQIELFAEREEVQDSDGLFLLPSEMQAMRAPLKVYLDHLFKESSFHNSFFFRGLYFCGDGNVAASEPALLPVDAEPKIDWLVQPPEPFEPLPLVAAEPSARRPVFLKHLFEQKIFHEDLLAQPVSKTMLSRNRTVLVAQILSLAIPLIGGLGILATYSGIQNQRETLEKFLSAEASDLDQLKVKLCQKDGSATLRGVPLTRTISTSGDALDENPASEQVAGTHDEEEHLLVAMARISRHKFYSPFIPSSWFSSLSQRTEDSLVAGFNHLVLKSLRFELDNRTNDLLNSVALYEPPVNDIRPASDERSLSYGRPSSADAVDKSDVIYAHGSRSLPSSPNYDQLPPIVDRPTAAGLDYQLHRFIEPLAALFANRARYERLRKKDSGSLEDLTQLVEYLGHARLPEDFDKDNELFQRALQTAQGRPLQTTDVHRQAGLRVTEMIEDIYQSSFERDVSYNYLSEISQTEALLARPEYTWLSTYVFDEPRSAFHDMTVSSSLRELRKALEDLSKERFMSRDASFKPTARLLLRRRLIWEREPLEKAIALYQQYESFVGRNTYSRSERLDDSVRLAALKELRTKVTTLVAQAQRYQPTESVPGESILKTSIIAEVKSFEEAQDLLVQLLEICDKLEMDKELHKAVAEQIFYLLRAIDREFNSERFYETRQENFSWWNGTKPFSYISFEVRNPDELSSYLTAQRKHIAFLGRELALPLFTFLSAQNMSPQLLQSSLSRWNEILTALDDYDAKKPGNSVAALENFIRYDMDRINLDDCSEVLRQPSDSSPDFFLVRRNLLRRQLFQRCEQLSKAKVFDDYLKTLVDYKEIEEKFNNTLAGKFPFADITGNQIFAEADPDAIVTFFKLLDKKEKSAREALQRSVDFGASQDEALEFLDRMDEVRVFFADFLEKKQQFPAFDFDVQLRVNQDEEKGANQIIDWNLDIGKKRFRLLDEDRTGRWLFGQPIHLSLRWANGSTTVPVASTMIPRIRVKERTASLDYEDGWSLLALIMRHRGDLLRHRGQPPPDAVEYVDVEPYTLKFTIPTRIAALVPPLEQVQPENLKTVQAEVYIRVSLLAPNKKDPLILPTRFPSNAPRLSLGNIEVKNRN